MVPKARKVAKNGTINPLLIDDEKNEKWWDWKRVRRMTKMIN